jgi:hypothetical protein
VRRGALRLDCDRQEAAVVGEQREVALGAMRQRKPRVGLQRRLDVVGQVRAIAEIGREHPVERLGGGGRLRRERQTVKVSHGMLPSDDAVL